MRYALVVFAVCALAAPAVMSAADRWDDETEHVNRTVKLDPGGTLRVKSFSGRVTITATDGRDVVIDAVRRAPRSRLDRITLDIHSEGSRTVVVDANHRERSWYEFTGNNVVETDLDIKVPRRADLDVSVFSAPLTIDGVEGSHKLHSFSGRMTLNDVAGPIRAHSFSGAVQISERAFEGSQTIDVQTFSGGIDVRVPESARAAISFHSFSGQLDSDIPLTIRTGNRRSLVAELGDGGGGELRFKTFSGSVRINR
jgi:arylamine N-acetyltransferase